MQLNKFNLNDFPIKTYDKIRYGDTDRQGHVNNAVFSTFLETGRVEILHNNRNRILSDGASFVIASLKLDFLLELKWPGKVDIGTGVIKVGKSSIRMAQCLYQKDKLVATAKTVIVQTDIETGSSKPLSSEAKVILNRYSIEKSSNK
jgi:acyl-CoA thioester hydrolase